MNTGNKPRRECRSCGRVVAHGSHGYPLPHKCTCGKPCKAGLTGARSASPVVGMGTAGACAGEHALRSRYIIDESDYIYPTLRRADDDPDALPFPEAKAALVKMLKDRVQHWRDALANARNTKDLP